MEKKSRNFVGNQGERYQDARDSLKTMRGKLLDLAEKVKEEVVALSHLGRKKLDIIALKKQRDNFLKSLGEKTYDLIRRGIVSMPELTTMSTKLDDLSVKISSLEREVEGMARKAHSRKSVKDRESGGRSLKINKTQKKPSIKRGGTKEEEE